VGRPNVGKSTLMNALLGQKIAIVSPKPQTTRHRILGILNGEGHQVVFLDTPGIIQPKYSLHQSMMQAARKTLGESDLVVMLSDATQPPAEDDPVIEEIRRIRKPKLCAINKIDLVDKLTLLPRIERIQAAGCFDEIVPVSALKSQGLDLLLKLILERLPEADPLYPPDIVSTEPERFFVSEIIREQILTRTSEEIPHAASVWIESFRENPGGKDHIQAVITVEKESQKGILIGKEGRALKAIGTAARREIEVFLDRPVYLEIHVQVRKAWRKDPQQIRRLGYE
jgi:GTP-binding protein Era